MTFPDVPEDIYRVLQVLDQAAADQRDDLRDDRNRAEQLAADGLHELSCMACGDLFAAPDDLFSGHCGRCAALTCRICGHIAEEAMYLAPSLYGCRECA